ncbi:DUF2726 domain-containing protein [Vreelandella glaciei]|uniref:DUF2726 domain-containing protein n=1 Tax=Vreelandella glaciei TaxID=186761 RepID=UPI0030EB2238|tara:strand:+ start:1092 stop:1901 length:810 start_codon:yes stop_codon:yes gene_type:complete
MEVLTYSSKALMLAGAGVVIGSWLSFWLGMYGTRFHKLTLIASIFIIALTVFIVFNVSFVRLLYWYNVYPLSSFLFSIAVTYSVLKVAWDPIEWAFRKRFEDAFKDDSVSSKTKRREPKVRGNEKEIDKISFTENLIKEGGAYKRNSFIMTPTEQGVYKILEKAYGDKYYIFCQVRVVDIIQPNTSKYQSWTREYKSLFRQISQWHFDYVMCDKGDFGIFCALELDDSTHERADRVRRDRILNAVCKDAGLNLKRMRLNHESKKVEVIS